MRPVKDYINLLPEGVKKPSPFATRGFLLTLLIILAWLGLFGWQVRQYRSL